MSNDPKKPRRVSFGELAAAAASKSESPSLPESTPSTGADVQHPTTETDQHSTRTTNAQATNTGSRTSTPVEIRPAGEVVSHHAADADIQNSTEHGNAQSTATDYQHSTAPVNQNPPPALMSTVAIEPASRQASRRMVESRKPRPVESRKGDRHRSDRVSITTRMNQATVQRMKHFCVDHKLEQQEFAELAAIRFMDLVESESLSAVGSKKAHDERELMILFKTAPSIINLYLQYNPENKWKQADDYEGQKYNDIDIRRIELGILQTQVNARFRKINSFKYYTVEIEDMVALPAESQTIDIMLKQHRRRWNDWKAEAGK
ncbi:MAG: hypothetical protein ABIP75_09835 [Pyrinomonadaceae bacterium]